MYGRFGYVRTLRILFIIIFFALEILFYRNVLNFNIFNRIDVEIYAHNMFVIRTLMIHITQPYCVP